MLDLERVRFEGPDLPRLVRGAYEKWGHSQIKIERAMYGHGLIRELRREGLPITSLEADTDKVTRALTAAARYEAHDVYHPRGGRWVSELEQELVGFPNATHDDQVDAVAYAARALPELAFAFRPQRHRGTTLTAGLLEKEL